VTDQAAFWRLATYDQIGSTSDLCRSLAEAGEPEGFAVLAKLQTKGRGSRGRTWQSDRGNLFLSVLLRPIGPVRESGLWALLAGVAIAEALEGVDGIALKWPNDILLNGAKLGGVLVDSTTDESGGLAWLVIGMGLNLAHAPEGLDRAVASLDGRFTPEALAARILDRIAHWRRVRILEGFSEMRAAWLKHALPKGTVMQIRLRQGIVSGRFEGIGEDGRLMLHTGERVQGFATGEIWLAQDPEPSA
jgi:BirA family biotin operon repressor/biotin-[acetyl-CoA-carboxylase] ligase